MKLTTLIVAAMATAVAAHDIGPPPANSVGCEEIDHAWFVPLTLLLSSSARLTDDDQLTNSSISSQEVHRTED